MIGVMSVLVGALSLGWAVYTGRVNELTVPVEAEFFCSIAPNSEGGESPVVIYRNEKGDQKNWLRMVHNMGDGWDTLSRCEEIAQRMNRYKADGLVSFDYKPWPERPGEYVICARTMVSENCNLVLTLTPEDEPYAALQRVAGALLPGNPESLQGSGPISLEQPMEIPLANQL